MYIASGGGLKFRCGVHVACSVFIFWMPPCPSST